MKTLQFAVILIILITIAISAQSQEEVMNYKELHSYLPETVSGYEAGEPDGQTTTMQGMSFSSAEIRFTDASGNYVHITLLDYIAAVNMYRAATAMWNAGMSFEDDETSAKSIQWADNIVGWQEYRKKDREAKLALGIGERFFFFI